MRAFSSLIFLNTQSALKDKALSMFQNITFITISHFFRIQVVDSGAQEQMRANESRKVLENLVNILIITRIICDTRYEYFVSNKFRVKYYKSLSIINVLLLVVARKPVYSVSFKP